MKWNVSVWLMLINMSPAVIVHTRVEAGRPWAESQNPPPRPGCFCRPYFF